MRPWALLLLPALAVPAAPENDGERLIREYGLREAVAAVATRPNWRVPRVIVVDAGVPGLLEALRRSAPRIEFVAARSSAEMTAAAPRADVLVGRAPLICNAAVLAAGRELRWVQTVYAGVELCTNKAAFSDRGILLTNMRAIVSPGIAEHAIALTFALSRGLHLWLPRQSRQEWNEDSSGSPLRVVAGKTMLVVGLGGIGNEVAVRAKALGMTIIATRASQQPRPAYVEYVGAPDELPALIGRADVVVNAAPLTPATTGIFDAALFARMKRSAYFINVGRGGSVVTLDLANALQQGVIGGAGIDVTDPEPLPKDHPLWLAPNTILTPHVAGQSDLSVEPQLRLLRENLRRYQAGEKMLSVVDVSRGY